MSLITALDARLTANAERKTHGGLHVSDVSNGCTRKTWHRIHKGKSEAFTPLTLKKMRYGLLWEAYLVESFKAQGGIVDPPQTYVWRTDGVIDVYDADAYDADPTKYAGPADLVGHPDVVTREPRFNNKPHVYEIKTTMLFRSGFGAPQHADKHTMRTKNGNYVTQASKYAEGAQADLFTVYVSDRGTGSDNEHTFTTVEEVGLFNARLERHKAALDPLVEPEPDLPPWTLNAKGKSYLCRSCPVHSCQFNEAQLT